MLHNRIRTVRSWVLVLALVWGAFAAGSSLRMQSISSPVTVHPESVQANALLKFTPESPPATAVKAYTSEGDSKELMSAVLRMVKSYYVEPITRQKETEMARGAVKGMLSSLSDPDSRLLVPEERKLLQEAGEGRFSGTGAILALRENKIGDLDTINIVIVAPMPGSPAESAGLRPGDSITHLDGKWIITHNPFEEPEFSKLEKAVRNKDASPSEWQGAWDAAGKKLKEGVSVSDALEALTTKTSGKVNVTIQRPGQSKAIDVSMTQAVTQVDPVVSEEMGYGMLYVKISQFNPRAVKEFGSLIDRAAKNGPRLKGLILDLRNNPGGLLESAAIVTGRITGGGLLANIQEKGRNRIIKTPKSQALGVPIVVLTNGGTASVAELVAGTLRDREEAVLVGDKTFGDALMQTPLVLKDGSHAILTTGKMLTSGGYDFHEKGLTPDTTIQQNQRRKDAQLQEAVTILRTRLGRI